MPAESSRQNTELRDQLTLEEKCLLLGGASTWRSHPIDRLGIPTLKLSDGPNGVRGDGLGTTGTPGMVIPVGIALGATWNAALIGELGDLLGVEAQRKGAHVLLGPTVNLHRTPIGGRVFECFSEDPELSARLAVAFIEAVQAHDVAVTVKHFAANDTEVDRRTVDVHADERVLRELYFRPFEAAVREAGAWGVMSAYNRVRGDYCAESRWLLTEVLRDDWGFDGFVVSDWFGFHDTVGAADAGLNLTMPGPQTIYGSALEAAVERGDVDEARVDQLVDDLLRLIDRTRARERSSERAEESVDDPADRALCRRAVAEGAVLARNEGVLPLSAGASIAVVGPNALKTRIMGGGSSSLATIASTPLLDALGGRVASVVHEPGVRIDRMPPVLGERFLSTHDGEPGLLVEYRNDTSGGGDVVASSTTSASRIVFFGSAPAGVDSGEFHVTVSGIFTPETTGPHTFSGVLTGAGVVEVGDTLVVDDPNRELPRGSLFFGNGCEEQTVEIDCVAGEPIPIRLTCAVVGGFSGIRLGMRPRDPEDMFDRAIEAARYADTAVVVVGTNSEWETEGEDRETIALPGEQDALVSAVAAVNPNTVVVVNAGSPVAMPWFDEVSAVLIAYFGGTEMGNGVADVLLGDADPGGRLPVTYPRELIDSPAMATYAPVEGVQRYTEGLHVGYRGHVRDGVEPLLSFGHGLSYGSVDWGEPSVPDAVAVGDDIDVTFTLTSTGDRDATVVAQCYFEPIAPVVDRAVKELAAWTKTVVPAGATQQCTIRVPGAAFRRWRPEGGWTIDPGAYDLHVASSSDISEHIVRVVVG
jgi:beta-glucosidase